MKKIILFLAIVSLQLLFSQNVFRDDFSSYNTGVPLSGQGLWTNNSSAPNVGLGGCSGTGCVPANVVPKAMSYINYGSTTKVLKVDGVKDGVAHPVVPSIATGDFYVSYVLNLTAAPISENPNDFFRVNSGSLGNVTYRMVVKNAGFGFNIGIRKGGSSNATVYSPTLYNFDEDVLIVLKYSHLPNANDDVLNMYVNPVFVNGEPTTADAITASGFDQAGDIDRVAFRLNQNLLMPSGFAGLVSVSKSWVGLAFPSMSLNTFESSNFVLNSLNANEGFLDIKSNTSLNNAQLTIFDIQGRKLEEKTISLTASLNQIAINPIQSKGIYIVQISDNNYKFTYKITIK